MKENQVTVVDALEGACPNGENCEHWININPHHQCKLHDLADSIRDGKILLVDREAILKLRRTCGTCGGRGETGFVDERTCWSCNGTGHDKNDIIDKILRIV